MKRLLLPCCCLLLAAAPVNAQRADRISYYDRAKKKQDTIQGRIKEESPKEIVIERGTRADKVRVADLIDIDYQIPAALNIEVRGKARKEEEAALKEPDRARRLANNDQAIAGYREIIQKLGKDEKYRFARRHTQYKIAVILTREAEDDKSKLGAAIEALTQFKTDYPTSWQIGALGKLLAHAQIAKEDMRAAQATFDEFARRDDLPEDIRQEYGLLGIRALLEAKAFSEAERKLTALAKSLAKDSPQAARVAIYLAACKAKSNLPEAEKSLQAIIRGDGDVAIKALAYNTLGDAYYLNKDFDRAFWQYLWVDQEYPQDREEHSKALYYLSILFDKVKKSPARAQACRDRLLNEKAFAGLEYQKRAAKESRKPSREK